MFGNFFDKSKEQIADDKRFLDAISNRVHLNRDGDEALADLTEEEQIRFLMLTGPWNIQARPVYYADEGNMYDEEDEFYDEEDEYYDDEEDAYDERDDAYDDRNGAIGEMDGANQEMDGTNCDMDEAHGEMDDLPPANTPLDHRGLSDREAFDLIREAQARSTEQRDAYFEEFKRITARLEQHSENAAAAVRESNQAIKELQESIDRHAALHDKIIDIVERQFIPH